MNAGGTYRTTGSANLTAGGNESISFRDSVSAAFAGTPLDGRAAAFATACGHYAPWASPVWMTGWELFFAILGSPLLVGRFLAETGLVLYRGLARGVPA